MLAVMKKLILAVIILFCGFFIWVLYSKYGTAAWIIPLVGAIIYTCWNIFNKKIPENKYPELSDSDKERIMNDPEVKRIRNEIESWHPNIFKKKGDK